MNGQASRHTGPRRLNVLMICAHEPTLDPRIHWEAEGAANRFNVTVLGFNRDDGSLPALARHDGYEIRRMSRCQMTALTFAWHLKDALHGVAWAVVLPLLALLFLPIVLVEGLRAAYRLSRRTLRAAVRMFQAIAALARRWGWRGTGLVVSVRGPVTNACRTLANGISTPVTWVVGGLAGTRRASRLRIMLGVLRYQFAPTTRLFWNHLRELPAKPDVVHCNDLDTLLVGVLARKYYGCRVIYDAHEYYPHADPNGGRMEVLLYHALEKLLIRKVDAVVTVNHRLAEVMRRAYGLRRVHPVPNAEPWVGVSSPPHSSMSELARGRLKFLFQGRFSPRRGLEEVINAWTRIDGSQAVLFIRGPDNIWRQELIELSQRLELLGRSVHFLEPVQERDLVVAAAEADVGIIPYKGDVEGYKYACPNKLSQYLHAGLMILTNDLPYIREVVEESGAGLHYRVEDLDSLVEAVARMTREPDLVRCCRANALRYARETFNWQSFSEALYSLYQPETSAVPLPAQPSTALRA